MENYKKILNFPLNVCFVGKVGSTDYGQKRWKMLQKKNNATANRNNQKILAIYLFWYIFESFI